MYYQSTRDAAVRVTSAQAITRGISADGGLFVPESFPPVTLEELSLLSQMGYIDRAKAILKKYLTDFTGEELDKCVRGAYEGDGFDCEAVAPLAQIGEGVYLLELWHGPTCAFKDMALQMLPFLMTTSAKKTDDGKTTVILVATSGDTGKAALEGFRDVEGTRILVFYPANGVSPMQKLQMVTQEGENVSVCAIRGNFDDAQTGVKKIFTDPRVGEVLAENGFAFSSANSINWGRLVPQIVYYISSYCDLLREGKIALGDPINIVVPTGNFGNILAAYYAKKMGLPVKKFICASNANNVLTDFFRTGEYNRVRPFYTTTSPSMDILISSNLERLLFDLCGRDDAAVRGMMDALKEEGKYTIPEAMQKELSDLFWGGSCDDAATAATIRELFESRSYLCDTHTAVGVAVYGDYVRQTGDETPTVIASTASPFKFSTSVLKALGEFSEELDEFERVEELSRVSGISAPAPLTGLRDKVVRFEGECTQETMESVVLSMLGIGK